MQRELLGSEFINKNVRNFKTFVPYVFFFRLIFYVRYIFLWHSKLTEKQESRGARLKFR